MNPITRTQAETALLICQTELKKPRPCLDAAHDYASRALRLIELLRKENTVDQCTNGANHGN
ncbi:MAG: hypothetical protein PHQ58_21870 [Rhodoferax sp.]|uniref:hypothetical protein n=1 Tax=Rhodoferax sp. TaxID=50421 RepID=UPI002637E3DE|nr:hypothetical protein [Rhodoferax sp.]MDD2883069.1 hypothetical protein [Rhodoferax sp.]